MMLRRRVEALGICGSMAFIQWESVLAAAAQSSGREQWYLWELRSGGGG